MVARRPEVLPDRHDVDCHRAEICEGGHDLVVGLPHPHDQAGLRDEANGLRPREDRQAPGVARGRPHGPLQTGHGLDVVVQHIRTCSKDRIERGDVALAVGDEHLDGDVRRRTAHGSDRLDEPTRTAVLEIVTRDCGDDCVGDAHPAHCLRHA